MPATNQFPWPSISNASAAMDTRVGRFLDSAGEAQQVIAAAWGRFRANPQRVTDEEWNNIIRRWRGKLEARHVNHSRGFHSYFLGQDCVATQKYDGTNVGITEDGLMLGRRLVIENDAPKYQGVPLDHVKKSLATVGAVKAGLLEGVAPEDAERLHCVVYGELMCNPGKFDYKDRKLGGSFACFGAILRFTEQRKDDDITTRVVGVLTAAGFEASVTKELCDPMDDGSPYQVQVKLMMCPALRKLFEAKDLLVVAPSAHAPLVDVVRQLAPWMMAGNGEGVVLTIGSNDGSKGGLIKWKTATESQGGTPDVLMRLVNKLRACGQKPENSEAKAPVQIVHPKIVSLISTMHRVSTSEEAIGKRPVSKKEKAAKKAKGGKKQPVIPTEELNAAYESALTKFDELDAWFETGASMKEVSSTLFDEIAEDVGCLKVPEKNADEGPSSAGGGGSVPSEKCNFAHGHVKSFKRCNCGQCKLQLARQAAVRGYVMKQVGTAFGSWKARKKGAGGF